MRATGRLSAMFVLAGWALCASTGAPWAADALAGLDPGAIALTDCPDEPGCPAIVLLDETTVNNDYLRARIQKRRALKIFTAEGVASCSDLNLYSKAGEENIRNLKGSTILPDGRRIELSRDNVQVKTAFKRGRTRILLKSATFPGVVPGSIVEFSYDVITENAAKYDGYLWDIQERLPVLSARFDLKPGGVAFDWLTLGGESVPVEHDHPFPGIHHFRATNVPALPHEPFAPSDEAWRARMHFSHPVSRVGWLVGYQMALIDELRRFMEKRGAAQSLVKSLLTDGQSRMQKVGTLYRYVQEKVQPGGDGVDESISVDDVIERGNGTELERTMLFVALLSEAGIDAGLVSIASRDAFPLNTSVPTADPFDTFAAAVKEETSWSYYDPATPHCPFGMVAPGKQGWVPNGVIVKPDRTRITESITIPSIAAARNMLLRDVSVEIGDGGAAHVSVVDEGEGLVDLDHRARYAALDEAARRSALESWLKETLPAAALESASFEGVESYSGKARIHYRFSLPDAVSAAGDRLVLSPSLFSDDMSSRFTSVKRRTPVHFPYRRKTVERIAFTLPRGYVLGEGPRPSSVREGPLSLTTVCVQDEEGRVVFSRRLEIDAMVWPVEQYPRLKGFFDQVREAGSQPLILKREEGS